ncbi:MAG: molecular chaperone DnaJ [Brevinematia bacterium]
MDFEKLIEAIDYFGINEKVSIKSLKRIYRNRSKELHPDKGGNEEEMRKMNNYYKIIIEYLESYEIPTTVESIMKSSPEAFMYFQYYKKQDKDGRVGF